MVVNEWKIRVRYAETDQMGVVHHAAYALYLEEARTEALRAHGLSYKQMEAEGVMLPIANINIKYLRSLRYDELITIKVVLTQMPTVKLLHHYTVYKEDGSIAAEAETVLIFVDAKTMRPCKPPVNFMDKMSPYF